jgi:O-antigen ligase
MSFYAVFESRMPLIESSWRVFVQRPWTGIGFGTSIDPQFVANATLFSAPTEKGFLPTALLEEVGIIGALPFAVFLIAFFVHYWKIRNIIALGMMACLLLLNLGEMMFFALGGMGLYSWSLIGAGIALGDRVVERS